MTVGQQTHLCQMPTVTHYGVLDLYANMPDPDHPKISIAFALINPQYRRILVGGSKLDDNGYWIEQGGGGLRIRKGMHGSTLLALPRVRAEGDLLITKECNIGKIPRHGPIDFGVNVANRGSLYAIPDACFKFTTTESNHTETVDDTEAHVASAYGSADTYDRLHTIYGHKAFEVIARMKQ